MRRTGWLATLFLVSTALLTLDLAAACSSSDDGSYVPSTDAAGSDGEPTDESAASGDSGPNSDSYRNAVLASGPIRYFRFEEPAGATSFVDSSPTPGAPANAVTSSGGTLTAGADGALPSPDLAITLEGSSTAQAGLDCGILDALSAKMFSLGALSTRLRFTRAAL